MSRRINPTDHTIETRRAVGYVPRHEADRDLYERIGFKCGLEVHQQLDTEKKLFCHCPCGHYQEPQVYNAEIVRHMRPTLSELGEYDGTALMEFKTRKNIFYRLRNDTACTYEFDDTPPFLLNREALDISMEIALLLKTSVVGEVHITRKQYLDGSIPTGFQRTAIIGINGEIPLSNKKVGIIQISLEEDSCREISDVRHDRVYSTDRLGMPLIETVTHPHMKTPDEAFEAGQYIRFLTRSSGRVRTGIGAARQDVNVSVTGGTRVEIKGVQRIHDIPELTHNEAFRQMALLRIADLLKERSSSADDFAVATGKVPGYRIPDEWTRLRRMVEEGQQVVAVNLPGFAGMLSHFTAPGRTFANEIEDRLYVIACLERPFMLHSEQPDDVVSDAADEAIRSILKSKPEDAWVLVWGPKADIPTAVETIEERCRLAFDGVPDETRKALVDGTTMFERVLPGPDRMYPDTDSAPIPVKGEHIERIRKQLPVDVSDRMKQLTEWGVPRDTFTYILSKNLVPLIERIIEDFDVSPVFVGTLFGHHLKHLEGQFEPSVPFSYDRVKDLFQFVEQEGLHWNVIPQMLRELYPHPNMELDSVLTAVGYRKLEQEDLVGQIPSLATQFEEIRLHDNPDGSVDWIMGQLRLPALGNMDLKELRNRVVEVIHA